jgi:hypothetical protein
MTRDRSDAIVISWSPSGRADRRIVFEPLSSGGYTRVEQARSAPSGEGWWTVGSERVDSVAVETPS